VRILQSNWDKQTQSEMRLRTNRKRACRVGRGKLNLEHPPVAVDNMVAALAAKL
jgi:hypothetical protein